MPDNPSLWPVILPVLGAAGGLAALWGVWLNRRQPQAQLRLITAQAEDFEHARDLKSVEASNRAVESLVRALDKTEAACARLEREREEWQTRERLLENQLETLHAQHRCDTDEIEDLRAKLGYRAGNGKGI